MDTDKKPAKGLETEFLLTSRPGALLNAQQMLSDDRKYWGIETGLHLRLDNGCDEDSSRVRNRTSAFNLALIRRAVVSIAVRWIKHCSDVRSATMKGFYDSMCAKQNKKAFSLVTVCHSSWLPK